MLNKIFVTLFACILLTSPVNAQDCDCKAVLTSSIQSIATNYALFKIKVNPERQANYDAYNKLYFRKAEKLTEAIECQRMMDDWVKYFNDKHLWVTVDPSSKKIRYQTIDLNLKAAKARWNNLLMARDSIEGLWEMEGYRAAILPDKNHYGHFNAVIVSSDNPTFRRGMLKMRLVKRDGFYDMDFYRRDSTMMRSTIRFTGPHTLIDEDDLAWRRLAPIGDQEKVPTLAELSSLDPYRPKLTWMDDRTAYFELPNCAPRYARVVDSLVKTHEKQLSDCAYLIVDVRRNGGGSDRTYKALLPYILTGPAQMPKVGYYMSSENIKVFKENGTFRYLDPKDTLRRDTILTAIIASTLSASQYHQHPKRVAILMGPHTASSGETFVIKSKISSRVITYGQATAGCIDGFNGNIIDMPGAKLRYPTSVRTMNLPQEAIDPFGILPDVPVSPHEQDAVQFVLQHLKQMEL